MALDLLVELEIVKARDRVTPSRRSPTDEARRWRRHTRPPCWWAVSAAAVVLSSSGSRDAAKRSTRCAEPCCLGGGARAATPSRSGRPALRCARRPSAFLFLAAYRLSLVTVNGARHWLIASVAVSHRSSVSSAAARGCSSPAVQHKLFL